MCRLGEDIRAIGSEDGGILLDLRTGRIVRVNPAGATIILSIQKGHSEGDIVRELALRCSAMEGAIGGDVREFIESLAEQGLVQRCSEAS